MGGGGYAWAERGALVLGLDLSPGLIAEAKRRGGQAAYRIGNGRDLDGLSDSAFDLVLAADSLPYLVAADLLSGHMAEFGRVLRPGGSLIAFNWSYRGDLARDAEDAAALAESHGFDLLRSAEHPFAIWDAAGFHLCLRR
jgi:SAM-dependent methyltransferase